MHIFSVHHSKAAYRVDFALYGIAVAMLAAYLLMEGPRVHRLEMVVLALLGLGSWTAVEYALHRFVLHGLQPFRRWHLMHHKRPTALICAPTVLSATLIATVVFLPMLLLGNVWRACGVTLGMMIGYVAYGITHHSTHHWRANNAWLRERKRWHVLHHHNSGRTRHFGVSTTFWDHIFGTAS